MFYRGTFAGMFANKKTVSHELTMTYGLYVVPERGFEPPRPFEHIDLNDTRLPIPPPGLG